MCRVVDEGQAAVGFDNSGLYRIGVAGIDVVAAIRHLEIDRNLPGIGNGLPRNKRSGSILPAKRPATPPPALAPGVRAIRSRYVTVPLTAAFGSRPDAISNVASDGPGAVSHATVSASNARMLIPSSMEFLNFDVTWSLWSILKHFPKLNCVA